MMKKALFLLFCGVLFLLSDDARAQQRELFMSDDGKYFAAAFSYTINVGGIGSSERKFFSSFSENSICDNGSTILLGFAPGNKALGVYCYSTRKIYTVSFKGKILSETLTGRPLVISRRFDRVVEQYGDYPAESTHLSLMSPERSVPKFDLPCRIVESAFSRDGRMVAMTGTCPKKGGKGWLPTLLVMSVKNGKYLRSESCPGEAMYGKVAFSADGSLMAYADCGLDMVRVVRVSDWKVIGSVSRGGTPAGKISFSGNGSYMAVEYGGWAARVYSLPDLKLVAKREYEEKPGWSVQDVRMSSAGDFLAMLGQPLTKNAAFEVRFVDIGK